MIVSGELYKYVYVGFVSITTCNTVYVVSGVCYNI